MKYNTRALYKKNFLRRFSIIHKKQGEILYQKHHIIKSVEKRLLYLKTRHIINDLTQMKSFIKTIDILGFDTLKTLQQIDNIQFKLASFKVDYSYIKIVYTLAEYLNGIKRNIITIQKKEILFLKRLFELTLTVMIQKINTHNTHSNE